MSENGSRDWNDRVTPLRLPDSRNDAFRRYGYAIYGDEAFGSASVNVLA